MNTPLRTILVMTAAAASLAVSATSAQAANLGTAITRGETMWKGDYLHRDMPGGYPVELIMQNDGNLVLKTTTGRICWASGTNPSGVKAIYQDDGNFVVYGPSGPLWASNTNGNTGSTVDITRNGELYAGPKRIAPCRA
jgi:hypothetical protein